MSLKYKIIINLTRLLLDCSDFFSFLQKKCHAWSRKLLDKANADLNYVKREY